MLRHGKPIGNYVVRLVVVWVTLTLLLTIALMLRLKRTFIVIISPLVLFVLILIVQIFTEYHTKPRRPMPQWAQQLVRLTDRSGDRLRTRRTSSIAQ
jgi:hypothetical protein